MKKRTNKKGNRSRASVTPGKRPNNNGHPWLRVFGARQHNLRDITVDIPLQRFVCVTGVSGSGKSSLVNDIIHETLARDLNGAVKVNPGDHDRIEGLKHLDKVIDIDQSPIGRTPRSNPATYIKVFDLIRNLFMRLPDSRVRGYKPGRFSFNVATGTKGGGRCEACEGNGANRMEMDFLADIWVTCPVCGGRRFNRETLQIRYKGKTIADVLGMDVQEALEHFGAVPKIAAMLQTLLDVGLDYMKLGQSSTTLSGGEAQRIKLARELVKKSTGHTLYLLDEPTTGLHFDDIKKLLAVLHGFVDAGNSVIVIEHNLDVVKTADWIIDLGPEGGPRGGRIVAQNTPEIVAKSKRSYTGEALRDVLKVKAPAASVKKADRRQRGNEATRQQGGRNGKQNVITVVGAQQHNLKDLTVEVPRGKMTACSGPSGSGKSSFAIDTVYTEGQRRYVESLSAYARQFIGQLQPPKVEHISGLSPSICIEQKTASKSPRSTVGTVTEIYDYMRILWARIGQPYCPKCKVPIGTQSSEEIVERVMSLGEGRKVMLLAPVERTGQESYQQLFERERANGYARVRIDGELHSLDEPIDIDSRRRHDVQIVVDRIIVRRAQLSRITDSIEQTLSLGNGVMMAQVVGNAEAGEDAGGTKEPRADVSGTGMVGKDAGGTKGAGGAGTTGRREEYRFSQHHACDQCGTSYDELTPHHFSFNARMGWCEACEGLGTQQGASPASIVIHPTRSIVDGAIAGWGRLVPGTKLYVIAMALADHIGFDFNRPWNALSEPQRMAMLHGCGDEWIDARLPGRTNEEVKGGDMPGVRFRWRGFYPAINRATRSSWQYRKRLEELVTEVPCEVCGGGRLRPDAAAVQIAGATIREACSWSLGRTLHWFTSLKLDARQRKIAGELLHEITSRLQFLVDVGLDYVSLHRGSATLSGGESQRIQLASQIGTGLTGVLYVLDEPTIGLHPRDNARLIGALNRLRDLGNTLMVVEHDREVIDSADCVLDFGPGAGRFGGEITAQAAPKALRRKRQSLTGRYLSLKESIPVPANRRPMPTAAQLDSRQSSVPVLTVKGAHENNLKEIDISFPLGRFTCVTGVSGSGKSSLVSAILYPALASRIHRASLVPGGHAGIEGVDRVDKVINVDQSPIGNSPTSNAATYTGVFDEIRELFAKLPESKVRGYASNRFSFNRPGGRCEACEGMGQQCIEMHFLPDVWVECESCKGTRYVPETLAVRYRGRNIADVLNMSVAEALELFEAVPKIRRMLQTLDDVGLSYLQLGQAAPTLSGGEAQRVKLAAELGRPQTGKTVYILDEPTTGLHFDDLKKLLRVLHRLVDLGNTCICIEHNLDVIKTADWLIDLGPEAGDDGGTIVVEGTPETVAATKASHTGRALKPVLQAGPVERRKPFDAEEAAAQQKELRARIDLGDEVKMPWQVDGKRWHTVDHLDRKGEPVEWEAGLLLWLVDAIESVGVFSATDWNDRSRVEIKGNGRGQWFCHILTGGRKLLDVLIRVPKGAFQEDDLRKQLQIKTLDERTDLPIYAPWERVQLRPRTADWDEIRLALRDMKDIRREPFRRFLKAAGQAYIKRFTEEQAKPEEGQPWRVDGKAWHLSQKSLSGRGKPRWRPDLLMTLIGRFKKLQPDLRLDWGGKVCVNLLVPGESKSAGKIVTNMPAGLRLDLRVPTASVTPTQIEKIGLKPEIKPCTGYDRVIFWVRSLNNMDTAKLAEIWRQARSARKARRLQSA